MNASNNPICGKCNQPIPANAPNGVCPRCVFAAALAGSPGKGHTPNSTTQFDPYRSRGFLPPKPEDLNERLKDLHVESLIGHGGMGAVYRARQKHLDRVVALKILSPQLGSDPTFVERFVREAKTLAKLTHANIVMVFEFGMIDEMCFLVMEYIDGINLRDAIRNKTITPAQALQIVPQICEALQYAHDEGVVHRDIKPENILLNQRGQVKIADFGLAKMLDADANEMSLTGTHQVMGTRNYMAPEQIEKPQTVDHRADIYSLGVVFYELLTGELPIGRFANPSEKAPISSELDQVVLKTLEKEPDRRFQQASEIRTAVHDIERLRPIQVSQYQSPQPVSNATSRPPAPANALLPHAIGSVPFTIDNLGGGFKEVHGILHLYDAGMTLEFEVKDSVFKSIIQPLTTVSIPIDKISTVQLKRGMLRPKLTVTANSLAATKDVPGAEQGSFRLKIASTARDRIDGLVGEFQSILAKQVARPVNALPLNPFFPPTTPTPPIKSETSQDESADAAIQRLESPVGYLKVVGILNLIINASVMIGMITRVLRGPFHDFSLISKWGNWNNAGSIRDNFLSLWGEMTATSFSPFQLSGGIVSFAMGILILVAVSNIRSLKNYSLCVAIMCIAILPIYSLHFFGCIFAIWCLVVLLDPKVKCHFQDGNPLAAAASPALPTKRATAGKISIETPFGNLSSVSILVIGAIIGLALIAKRESNKAKPKPAKPNPVVQSSPDEPPIAPAIEQPPKAVPKDGLKTESDN